MKRLKGVPLIQKYKRVEIFFESHTLDRVSARFNSTGEGDVIFRISVGVDSCWYNGRSISGASTGRENISTPKIQSQAC